MSLYHDIGEDLIRRAIRIFYTKAFGDIVIGHLFLQSDFESLIGHQSAFAISMLGGPKLYQGKALTPVHANRGIRPPHFGRRQVLMRETLDELALRADLRDGWLAMEEALRPLVMGSHDSCRA